MSFIVPHVATPSPFGACAPSFSWISTVAVVNDPNDADPDDVKFHSTRPYSCKDRNGTEHTDLITTCITNGGTKTIFPAARNEVRLLGPRDSMSREHSLLGSLQHPNIPAPTSDLHDGDRPGTACYYMEYCSGRVPPLDQQDVYELVDAMRYLHIEQRIIHGDIKPANIVRSSITETIQLIDLGEARRAGEPPSYFSGATMNYFPPEVFSLAGTAGARVDPQDGDMKADMWALGVTIYQIVMENHQEFFFHRDQHTINQKVFTVPHSLRTPLKAMLCVDPKGRATAAQVLNMLRPPQQDPCPPRASPAPCRAAPLVHHFGTAIEPEQEDPPPTASSSAPLAHHLASSQ
jgi:serine/threonine protein kinase